MMQTRFLDSNTSHVIVKQNIPIRFIHRRPYSNTSHVIVKHYAVMRERRGIQNSNTSHVIVKPRIFHPFSLSTIA